MLDASLSHANRLVGNITGDRGLPAALDPTSVTLYRPDAVIYAQGDMAGFLHYVHFGAVRILRLTVDGRRQISAFHFAGEVFGF